MQSQTNKHTPLVDNVVETLMAKKYSEYVLFSLLALLLQLVYNEYSRQSPPPHFVIHLLIVTEAAKPMRFVNIINVEHMRCCY